MATAVHYCSSISKYGTELVAETAAVDPSLSDEDYTKVWEAVSDATPRKGKQRNFVNSIRERDAAKAEFYKDFSS